MTYKVWIEAVSQTSSFAPLDQSILKHVNADVQDIVYVYGSTVWLLGVAKVTIQYMGIKMATSTQKRVSFSIENKLV